MPTISNYSAKPLRNNKKSKNFTICYKKGCLLRTALLSFYSTNIWNRSGLYAGISVDVVVIVTDVSVLPDEP